MYSTQIDNVLAPSSPTGVPRVHPQVSPRHERARIGHQEHRRPSVLLRLAQPAQHVLFRPLCPSLGVSLEKLFHHGCDDVPGRYRVDSDSIWLAPF